MSPYFKIISQTATTAEVSLIDPYFKTAITRHLRLDKKGRWVDKFGHGYLM